MKNRSREKEGICRRLFQILICVTMVLGLAGCGGSDTKKDAGIEEAVKIPITLIVDSSTGKKNEERVVEEFNKEFQGVYEADVEWIMETENEYR